MPDGQEPCIHRVEPGHCCLCDSDCDHVKTIDDDDAELVEPAAFEMGRPTGSGFTTDCD